MNEFENYRGLLFSIAYRMLGSATDADDLVQDAFVRYASADRDVVRDVKAFLVTVLTRLALDRLKSAQVKREEYVGNWLPEPVFTGNDADPFASAARNEAVHLAFIAALERLSPEERAVLLLKDVLDYDHAGIAEMLGLSAAASRQHLHRARERVSVERQRARPAKPEQERIIGSFVAALQNGDADALRNLLTADVVARGDGGGKVPGAGMHPILGFDNVARLYLGLIRKVTPQHRFELAEVNGDLALLMYVGGEVSGVVSFDFDGERIAGIATVLNPDKLEFAKRQLSRRSPESAPA